MTHEIRRNAQGDPWVLFIPTEPGEMSLRPRGGPRDGYDAVLSDLGMSRARDILGPLKPHTLMLGFPGVADPDDVETIYRLEFTQGCALLGFNK